MKSIWVFFGFNYIGRDSSRYWWGCEEFKWDGGRRRLFYDDLVVNGWCKGILERCNNVWFVVFGWLGGGWYCYWWGGWGGGWVGWLGNCVIGIFFNVNIWEGLVICKGKWFSCLVIYYL